MKEIIENGVFEQLSCSDPEDFVDLRRRLLADFILNTHGSIEHLANLQTMIDETIAMSGTPKNSLEHLAGLIDDRLQVIAQLSRTLAEEVKNYS